MNPAGLRLLRSALLFFGFLACGQGMAQSVTPQRQPGQAPAAQASVAPATAEAPVGKLTTAETERKGRMNVDIFIGVYLPLDKECKTAAGPRIEFLTNPSGGKMKTRNHPINLRDVPGAPRRNCIGTSPNGIAVIYRSEKRFKGEDKVVFRAHYPNGDIREVSAKVLVQ